MSTTKTVIFDFDGTLADSLELLLSLYNTHADQFGYQTVEPDELPRLRKLGYKKAMKQKGIKFYRVPKMVVQLGREMRQRMDEVKPYSGIVELLNNLRAEGYTLGVLTSNQTALVADFFKAHKFPPFDFIVSEKTLFGKGKALKRIMRSHNLAKEAVLYVGDEPRDVQASRKAGVRVIGVSWGLGGREGFAAAQPDIVADTTTELSRAIKKLL